MSNSPTNVNIAIIGAQKAGTTSLKEYLGMHESIITHATEEFAYFADEKEYALGLDKIFQEYGISSIETAQTLIKNVSILGNDEALKKLQFHNPSCKIIVSLRNPIERAYSSYTMEASNGWMTRPFDDIIDVINNRLTDDIMYQLFLRPGLYDQHITELFNHFKPEQVCFVSFNDIKTRPNDTISEIFSWLGLPQANTMQLTQVHNQTTQPRSTRVAAYLLGLRNNNGPLKRFAKLILPRKIYRTIGGSLIRVNQGNKRYEPMSSEAHSALEVFYNKSIQITKEITDIDLC